MSHKFDFSQIECLLFVIHKLGSMNTDWFAEDVEKLKDFRARLQYFARAASAYMKNLREDLQHKKGEDLKSETNRFKVRFFSQLVVLSNVHALGNQLCGCKLTGDSSEDDNKCVNHGSRFFPEPSQVQGSGTVLEAPFEVGRRSRGP